ncbi:uncharacterized protein PRCAT00006351001 [Priceomyces carsonii]|uniref:uncharacterized protein n=1 Tax=Priceomyces carsonii TaxID=28549 RepID=UPI002ED99159|nr:unnamed protein product [Priceomyces carsonii]
MTLIEVRPDKLPSLAPFLSQVCPGFSFLDYNVHYSLKNEKAHEMTVDWPLMMAHKAQLEEQYLNISRPPLNLSSNESTTYVSLPYHVTSLFKKIVNHRDKHQQGEMQIGANVNALSKDPFNYVQLNPGCLSTIVDLGQLDKAVTGSYHENGKNPFAKLTNNFNRFLKMSSNGLSGGNYHHLIASLKPHPTSKSHLVEKVLEYNPDTYTNDLTSSSKLLISSHVNIFNVIAIDSNSNWRKTTEICTDRPIYPYEESTAATSSAVNHKKVIENTLLRLQFRSNSIITSIKAFVNLTGETIAILGLDSGEIFMINLTHLTYISFDDFGLIEMKDNSSSTSSISNSSSSGNVPVTAIDVIRDPKFDFLILAGLANGEVVILNPYPTLNEEKSKSRYVKKVVAKDAYITYFKKFDLSYHSKNPTEDAKDFPTYLIGHFKISHKPITSITTTIPYRTTVTSTQLNPMLVAIASQDGFVKFLDLMATAKFEYGNPENPLNKSIVTDIISNYFNDGVSHVEFSPDFRFLSVAGKGDLIEIFKMSYYNVSGLLIKNSGNNYQSSTNLSGLTRRSFSETGNSSNFNQFLSPSSTSMSNHHSALNNLGSGFNKNGSSSNCNLDNDNELGNDTNYGNPYPLIIKDIKIVGRFKGHTNTVHKVSFIADEKNKNSTGNLVYKLMSCGFDGKIIIWEFDYKALPKVKKLLPNKKKTESATHIKKTSISLSPNSNSISSPKRTLSPSPNITLIQNVHSRGLSISNDDVTPNLSSFANSNSLNNNGSMNMTTILNSMSGNNFKNSVNEEMEHMKVVDSLYKSLYDLRIRKQFAATGRKFDAVIHPVVNDKLVPSIEIPLLSLDLSCLVRDGKIEGFYFDNLSFWCFSKSGDIFKYHIKKLSPHD